ncbi:MAG: HlyD family secretion protein [Gammaproteobacteria bacterium]
MKKRISAMLASVSAISGGFYAYHIYETHHPSTDNAYVIADVVHVAPQVSGRVIDVFVHNQDYVHAGDSLYKIDPKPFELALERARAHLQQVRQGVAHDSAAVASAESEVKRQEVLLQNTISRAKRSRELMSKNYVSQQTAEDAEADKLAARAALAVARARLNEAREQLGQAGDNNQSVRAAQAELDGAQWEVDNTVLSASCDGRIAQLTLQPGDAVQAGQSSFVLICDHHFWVSANFKETELAYIQPGQPVDITVDMYPGVPFRGKVESISGASGVAFSLLPPQNASGNWVKITQRVPVKIRVEATDPQHPLVVGTSAQVRVNTTTGS